MNGSPSPRMISNAYLKPVMQAFAQNGYNVEIQAVNYQFQQGGDRMLRIYTKQP
jgi:hypothetical protein